MDKIKNKLRSIRGRLSRYSLEYNDFSDDALLYDSEDYEDMSEVMTSQRDLLEDIYCKLDSKIEEAYEDERGSLQEIKAAVNEALSYIETVATKASCPWELDIPEYDTEVTEAIDWIDDALTELEELLKSTTIIIERKPRKKKYLCRAYTEAAGIWQDNELSLFQFL